MKLLAHLAVIVRGNAQEGDRVQYLRSTKAGKRDSWSEAATIHHHETQVTISDLSVAARGDQVAVAWITQDRRAKPAINTVHVLVDTDGGAGWSSSSEPSAPSQIRNIQGTGDWKRGLGIQYDHQDKLHLIWGEGHKVYYLKNFEGPAANVFDIPRRRPAKESVRYLAQYEPHPEEGCRCEACWCEEDYPLSEETNSKTGLAIGPYVEWTEERFVHRPALFVDHENITIIAKQTRAWNPEPVRNPRWTALQVDPVFSDTIVHRLRPTRLLVGWRQAWKTRWEPGDDKAFDDLGLQFQYRYAGTEDTLDRIITASRSLEETPPSHDDQPRIAPGIWNNGVRHDWRWTTVDMIDDADFDDVPSHPQVVTAPGGRLYAVYERGSSRKSNPAHENDIALSSSDDGGHSWSKPKRISHGYGPRLAVTDKEIVVLSYRPAVLAEDSQKAPVGEIWVSRSPDGMTFVDERLSERWAPSLAASALEPALAGVPTLAVHDGLWLAAWLSGPAASGAPHAVMVARGAKLGMDEIEHQIDIRPTPLATRGRSMPVEVRLENQYHMAVSAPLPSIALRTGASLRSGGFDDSKQISLAPSADRSPQEAANEVYDPTQTPAGQSLVNPAEGSSAVLWTSIDNRNGPTVLTALATSEIGAQHVTLETVSANTDGNAQQAERLLEKLYDSNTGAQREFIEDPDNEDSEKLAAMHRVWVYTQGIALSLASRRDERAKAQAMASWLCEHAVYDPVDPAIILGWHFSQNTQDDNWKDARLVTGASAWAVHGLGVFLASKAYAALKSTTAESSHYRHCYAAAVRGLARHRSSSGLVTAGFTHPNLLNTNGSQAYYQTLDDLGYKEDLQLVKAQNVVTEHNLDVLSVLNQNLEHQPDFPRSADEIRTWRDQLRHAIFDALWDDEEGRIVTGGEFTPSGAFRKSAFSAIDNCSWLSISVSYPELSEEEREKLAACLHYTIRSFVKPLPFTDGAQERAYVGAHYFPSDFADPYIDLTPEDQAKQPKSYHLEATAGLILGLWTFADQQSEHPDADSFRSKADELWYWMQIYVQDHGFPYSSQRIQDLSTLLPSSTALIWFLDVWDYEKRASEDPDRDLRSYAPERTQEKRPEGVAIRLEDVRSSMQTAERHIRNQIEENASAAALLLPELENSNPSRIEIRAWTALSTLSIHDPELTENAMGLLVDTLAADKAASEHQRPSAQLLLAHYALARYLAGAPSGEQADEAQQIVRSGLVQLQPKNLPGPTAQLYAYFLLREANAVFGPGTLSSQEPLLQNVRSDLLLWSRSLARAPMPSLEELVAGGLFAIHMGDVQTAKAILGRVARVDDAAPSARNTPPALASRGGLTLLFRAASGFDPRYRELSLRSLAKSKAEEQNTPVPAQLLLAQNPRGAFGVETGPLPWLKNNDGLQRRPDAMALTIDLEVRFVEALFGLLASDAKDRFFDFWLKRIHQIRFVMDRVQDDRPPSQWWPLYQAHPFGPALEDTISVLENLCGLRFLKDPSSPAALSSYLGLSCQQASAFFRRRLMQRTGTNEAKIAVLMSHDDAHSFLRWTSEMLTAPPAPEHGQGGSHDLLFGSINPAHWTRSRDTTPKTSHELLEAHCMLDGASANSVTPLCPNALAPDAVPKEVSQALRTRFLDALDQALSKTGVQASPVFEVFATDSIEAWNPSSARYWSRTAMELRTVSRSHHSPGWLLFGQPTERFVPNFTPALAQNILWLRRLLNLHAHGSLVHAAHRMGRSPLFLHHPMSTGDFSEADFEVLASALGLEDDTSDWAARFDFNPVDASLGRDDVIDDADFQPVDADMDGIAFVSGTGRINETHSHVLLQINLAARSALGLIVAPTPESEAPLSLVVESQGEAVAGVSNIHVSEPGKPLVRDFRTGASNTRRITISSRPGVFGEFRYWLVRDRKPGDIREVFLSAQTTVAPINPPRFCRTVSDDVQVKVANLSANGSPTPFFLVQESGQNLVEGEGAHRVEWTDPKGVPYITTIEGHRCDPFTVFAHTTESDTPRGGFELDAGEDAFLEVFHQVGDQKLLYSDPNVIYDLEVLAATDDGVVVADLFLTETLGRFRIAPPVSGLYAVRLFSRAESKPIEGVSIRVNASVSEPAMISNLFVSNFLSGLGLERVQNHSTQLFVFARLRPQGRTVIDPIGHSGVKSIYTPESMGHGDSMVYIYRGDQWADAAYAEGFTERGFFKRGSFSIEHSVSDDAAVAKWVLGTDAFRVPGAPPQTRHEFQVYITSTDVKVGARGRSEPFLGYLGSKTSLQIPATTEFGAALVHISLGLSQHSFGYTQRADIDVGAGGFGLKAYLNNEQILAEWVASQEQFRLPDQPKTAPHEFEVMVGGNRISIAARLLAEPLAVFRLDGQPVPNDEGWTVVHRDHPLLTEFESFAAKFSENGGNVTAFLRSMHAFVLQLNMHAQELSRYGVRIIAEPRQGASHMLEFVRQSNPDALNVKHPGPELGPSAPISIWNPFGGSFSVFTSLDGWNTGLGPYTEPLGPSFGAGQVYAPWTTNGLDALRDLFGQGTKKTQPSEPVPIPSAWPSVDGGGGVAYYGLPREVYLASVEEEWTQGGIQSERSAAEIFRNGIPVFQSPGNLLAFLQTGAGGFQIVRESIIDPQKSSDSVLNTFFVDVPPGAINLNRMFKALDWEIPDTLKDGVVVPGSLSGAQFWNAMSLKEDMPRNRFSIDWDSKHVPFRPIDAASASAHVHSDPDLERLFRTRPELSTKLQETSNIESFNAALSTAPSLVVASDSRDPRGAGGVFETGFNATSSGPWSPYVTTRAAPAFHVKDTLSVDGTVPSEKMLWFYYLIQENGLLVRTPASYMPLVLVPGPVSPKQIIGAQAMTWDDVEQKWIGQEYVPNPSQNVAQQTVRTYWHGAPAHLVEENHRTLMDSTSHPIAVTTDIYEEAVYAGVAQTVARTRGSTKVLYDGNKVARKVGDKIIRSAPLYPKGVVEFPVADIYRYQMLSGTDFFDIASKIVDKVFDGIELSHPIRLYKDKEGNALVHPDDHLALARMTLAGETFVPATIIPPPPFAIGIAEKETSLKDAEAHVFGVVPFLAHGSTPDVFQRGIVAKGDDPSLRALLDEPSKSAWISTPRRFSTLQVEDELWGGQEKPDAHHPRFFIVRPHGVIDVNMALGAGTQLHAEGNLGALLDALKGEGPQLAVRDQILPENIVGAFEPKGGLGHGSFVPNPAAKVPLPKNYELATIVRSSSIDKAQRIWKWETKVEPEAAKKRANELRTPGVHANPILTVQFKDDRPVQVLEGDLDMQALRELGQDDFLEFNIEWETLSFDQQATLMSQYTIPQDPNQRLVKRMLNRKVVSRTNEYPEGVTEVSIDHIAIETSETPVNEESADVHNIALRFVNRGIDLQDPIHVYTENDEYLVWKSDVPRFLALKRLNEETVPVREVPHVMTWPAGSTDGYPEKRIPALAASHGVTQEQLQLMKASNRVATVKIGAPKGENPFETGFKAEGTRLDLLDYYWFGTNHGYVKTQSSLRKASTMVAESADVMYIVRPSGGLAPKEVLLTGQDEVLVPTAIAPTDVLGSYRINAKKGGLTVNPNAKNPLIPEFGFASFITDVPLYAFGDLKIQSERNVGDLVQQIQNQEAYGNPILMLWHGDKPKLLYGHDTIAALSQLGATSVPAAVIKWDELGNLEKQTLQKRFKEALQDTEGDGKTLPGALGQKKLPSPFIPKPPRIIESYGPDNKVKIVVDERIKFSQNADFLHVVSTQRPELLNADFGRKKPVGSVDHVDQLLNKYPQWVSIQIVDDDNHEADLSMTIDSRFLNQRPDTAVSVKDAHKQKWRRPIPGLEREVAIQVELLKGKEDFSYLSNTVRFLPRLSPIGFSQPRLVHPTREHVLGGLNIAFHYQEPGFKAEKVQFVLSKTTIQEGRVRAEDYIEYNAASGDGHDTTLFLDFDGPEKSTEGLSLIDFLDSLSSGQSLSMSTRIIGNQRGNPTRTKEFKLAGRESPLVQVGPAFWNEWDQYGRSTAAPKSPTETSGAEPMQLTARKVAELQGVWGVPDYPELIRTHPVLRELLEGLPVEHGRPLHDEDIEVLVSRIITLVERGDVSTHGEWAPKWDRVNFPQFRNNLFTQLFGPLMTTGGDSKGPATSTLVTIWIRREPGSESKLMFRMASSVPKGPIRLRNLVSDHQYASYPVHTLSPEELLTSFGQLDTGSLSYEAWAATHLGPGWEVSLLPTASSGETVFDIGLMPKGEGLWTKEVLDAHDYVDTKSQHAVQPDGTIDLAYLMNDPDGTHLVELAKSVKAPNNAGPITFELATLKADTSSGLPGWRGTVRWVRYLSRK